MASPDLGLNQPALREGRCRRQLARLFRLGFLNPRIVDAMIAGEQPHSLNCQRLFEADLSVDRAEQHQLLGIAA